MKSLSSVLFAGVVALCCHASSAQPVYSINAVGLLNVQSVLHESGAPVNGFIWFCFDVYDAPTGGNLLAHDTNMNHILVSNGVANVTYRIGDLAALSLSPTQELYLQLDVSRTGAPGSFTVLNPRQRIVPALVASMAVRAEEARRLIEPLPAALMPVAVSNLTFTGRPVFGAAAGPPFAVASAMKVAGLNADTLDGYSSEQFWRLEGNGGTTAGTDFLGTTDDEPLELKVNYQRALRLEPNAESPNFIGGSSANSVTAPAVGAAIGGGGSSGVGGQPNAVQASYGTIGGGRGHQIGASATEATISGGQGNVVEQPKGAIGGGALNTVSAWGGAVGGGFLNTIKKDAFEGVIGGGYTNTIDKDAWLGVVGGGTHNAIESGVRLATVSGGGTNVVRVDAAHGAIGGGSGNEITTKSYGTIPGGREARTGDYGQMAYASGKFVSTGDAQSSLFVLRGSSPGNGAAAELFLDGAGERMHVRSPGAWMFDILVVGRSAAGAVGFHFVGLVENSGGGVMAFPAPPTVVQYGGTPASVVSLAANPADGTLRISAQWGGLDQGAKWVAKVRTAEIVY